MIIEQITNSGEKQTVVRKILESLPEWFGIAQAREEYIKTARTRSVLPRGKAIKSRSVFSVLKRREKIPWR